MLACIDPTVCVAGGAAEGPTGYGKKMLCGYGIRCGFLIQFCLDAAPKMDCVPS